MIEKKKQEIRQLAAKHGARDVRLSGSVARGDATPDSDVDFFVDDAIANIERYAAHGRHAFEFIRLQPLTGLRFETLNFNPTKTRDKYPVSEGRKTASPGHALRACTWQISN